jgi:hypothetical protein
MGVSFSNPNLLRARDIPGLYTTKSGRSTTGSRFQM